jgi:hypothetical protein
MAAKVTRLRPKRHDVICESIQLALDMPLGLRQETRDDLADALGRFAPPETWSFVMLNPDQAAACVEGDQSRREARLDAAGVERRDQPHPV